MGKIMVEGIDEVEKAVALAALYNASQPLGMGFMHYDPAEMTVEEADKLLQEFSHFDYLKGRVMKLHFDKPVLDFRLYDRDNGEGAGLAAVMNAVTTPEKK